MLRDTVVDNYHLAFSPSCPTSLCPSPPIFLWETNLLHLRPYVSNVLKPSLLLSNYVRPYTIVAL